jgi:hypothetical protein
LANIFTPSASKQRQDEYWAAVKEPSEVAREIWDKVQGWRKAMKNSTMWGRWARTYRTLHGLTDAQTGEASALTRRGSKGHRASVKSGIAATDARHQLSLISPVIPALEAIPINTAYRTLAQVREAKRIFDYFVQRKGLGKVFYKCADYMQRFGVSWIVSDWDPFGGVLIPPQMEQGPDAQPTRSGDMRFRAYTPLDLTIDLNQDGHHDWFIARDKVNRWKLVDDHPDLRSVIMNLSTVAEDDRWMGGDFRFEGTMRDKEGNSDLVPIWTLHHRPMGGLPNGRIVRIITDQDVLYEGAYPYQELTMAEMNASQIWNSALGDSTAHHAVGMQQALDRALSAIVTNVLALGHQLVSIEDEDFELAELADGISAIVSNPGPGGRPPQGISLLTSQAESAKCVEILAEYIHSCLGVNAVIRGEPQANIKSGAYAGLLVQQAAQFNSAAQYSFARCVEQVGNHLLDILKRFADHPILGEISGPDGQWRLREFSKADYMGIHRLAVKEGNPAEDTRAFKKQIADQLLEARAIATPQQYMAALSTNSDELLTEAGETQKLLIKLENETMQRLAAQMQDPNVQLDPEMAAVPYTQPGMQPPEMGGPPPLMVPPVLITDDETVHIPGHRDLLDSPGSRGNPALVQIVGAHIAWHLQSAMTKPPELAMYLQQPVPSMMMGPQPGAPGAPPPGKEGPKPGGGGVKQNGVQQVKPPQEAQPQAGMGP